MVLATPFFALAWVNTNSDTHMYTQEHTHIVDILLFDETQVTLKQSISHTWDVYRYVAYFCRGVSWEFAKKILTTYTGYRQAKPCGKPRGSSTRGFEKEKGDGGGGEGVFLKGCARQLLLRQLLMSTEQQLAEIPEDTLPASSQMEGLGLEGHRG